MYLEQEPYLIVGVIMLFYFLYYEARQNRMVNGRSVPICQKKEDNTNLS